MRHHFTLKFPEIRTGRYEFLVGKHIPKGKWELDVAQIQINNSFFVEFDEDGKALNTLIFTMKDASQFALIENSADTNLYSTSEDNKQLIIHTLATTLP